MSPTWGCNVFQDERQEAVRNKGAVDHMMRNRWIRGGLAAGLGLAALGMSVAPAGATTFRETEDVAGDVFSCEGGDFTITEGVINIVIHEGSSRSGNQNFTGTVTPSGVVAVDADGNEYDIRGALWFGGTYNAKQGSWQETFTGKLQIVGQGSGTVGSVNLTFHVSPNEKTFAKDFSTCLLPD